MFFFLNFRRSQNLPNSIRICAGNFFSRLHSTKSSSTSSSSTSANAESTKISREEMLRLFILKLDEEANYFDASPSPEEELCECSKCQVRNLKFREQKFSLFGLYFDTKLCVSDLHLLNILKTNFYFLYT